MIWLDPVISKRGFKMSVELESHNLHLDNIHVDKPSICILLSHKSGSSYVQNKIHPVE